MDPFTLIQMALTYGPLVKQIIDIAQNNEEIVDKVSALSKPLANVLEGLGTHFFPQAKPGLHIAAAAMATFDPNITKWLQGAMNVLLDPSPNLTVDGIYGKQTKAAVEKVQSKLGLTVDGWAGAKTQAAIATLLQKGT